MLVNSPEVRADERPTSFANIILTPAGLVPRHGERLPRCHLTTENTTYILMCAGVHGDRRINRMWDVGCMGRTGLTQFTDLLLPWADASYKDETGLANLAGTTNDVACH